MQICLYLIFNRIVEIRSDSQILTSLIQYRNDIFMNTDAVMDVWSFYNLCFQTFPIFYLYPDIGSFGVWTVYRFGIAKKQGIFAVVAVKAY